LLYFWVEQGIPWLNILAEQSVVLAYVLFFASDHLAGLVGEVLFGGFSKASVFDQTTGVVAFQD
jgi:hypothetical protein